MYTFLTLSLPSLGVCGRESFPCLFPSFLLTVSAQRLYRSLEWLYRWVLSLTSFARAVVPMTGTTGGPSGSSAQYLAAQELKAMRLFRPGTAQVPV